MGQTSAPGNFTSVYCSRALTAAEETNIIEHPINARQYGYPAYDYDWWQPSETLDNTRQRWNAGWYDGYWSYWVGGVDSEELSYSGLGYSSRKLSDGQVDAWKYALLDGPVVFAPRQAGGQNRVRAEIDGETGASEQWYELNYSHKSTETGINGIDYAQDSTVRIYTLHGVSVKTVIRSALYGTIEALPSGCYLIKDGNKTTKLIK